MIPEGLSQAQCPLDRDSEGGPSSQPVPWWWKEGVNVPHTKQACSYQVSLPQSSESRQSWWHTPVHTWQLLGPASTQHGTQLSVPKAPHGHPPGCPQILVLSFPSSFSGSLVYGSPGVLPLIGFHPSIQCTLTAYFSAPCLLLLFLLPLSCSSSVGLHLGESRF